MSFVLGGNVHTMTVVLSPGGRFSAVGQRQDKQGNPISFDPGTVLELRFPSGPIWTASIAADLATWDEADTAVTDVLTAGDETAQLWNSFTDRLWASGPVVVES